MGNLERFNLTKKTVVSPRGKTEEEKKIYSRNSSSSDINRKYPIQHSSTCQIKTLLKGIHFEVKLYEKVKNLHEQKIFHLSVVFDGLASQPLVFPLRKLGLLFPIIERKFIKCLVHKLFFEEFFKNETMFDLLYTLNDFTGTLRYKYFNSCNFKTDFDTTTTTQSTLS